MTYQDEYKEELRFLEDKGIVETVFDSKDGKISLSELLREYAFEWYMEHDQGEWGKQY